MGKQAGIRFTEKEYAKIDIIVFGESQSRAVVTAVVNGVTQTGTAILKIPSRAKSGEKEAE